MLGELLEVLRNFTPPLESIEKQGSSYLSSADAENTVVDTPQDQPVAMAEEVNLPDGMNEACRREITVEIPAEVVSKRWDTTTGEYSKVARVPGFRKGKVPASVVRNRFASEIRTEVLESLVPEYFRDSV